MCAVKSNRKGFTLIELVIGIATLAVALTFMTGALMPQAERSTDPWFQVRSAELAQSMMSEILSRSFDENSSRNGNPLRCDEDLADTCIANANLPSCSIIAGFNSADNVWTEEDLGSRDLWDDVDDFHCYQVTGNAITNIENTALDNVYANFTVSVEVQYAGTDLGFTDNRLAKLVIVTVTPPHGDPVVYSSYRTNY